MNLSKIVKFRAKKDGYITNKDFEFNHWIIVNSLKLLSEFFPEAESQCTLGLMFFLTLYAE